MDDFDKRFRDAQKWPRSPTAFTTDGSGRIVPVQPSLLMQLAPACWFIVLLLAIFGQVPWVAVKYGLGGFLLVALLVQVAREWKPLLGGVLVCGVAYLLYRASLP